MPATRSHITASYRFGSPSPRAALTNGSTTVQLRQNCSATARGSGPTGSLRLRRRNHRMAAILAWPARPLARFRSTHPPAARISP
ncbi:hypothetical protein GTS_35040 [Gandjariella thermophila]|uniref:Uncharacterized protein n=1 Tax=Gandjariella thermophila TaxID=1931992 RepID=A0A4D4J5Q1_9PSEU|nr:hypothetical protein GTS_35040 [Gandjariella thermophila]